mmetsp:Transcript_48638/g.146635  ORF Transcript_48638/g.146635 Transcript_48638/m.146635 type:complete len:136 (-) Transcript_48638:502-909(-)
MSSLSSSDRTIAELYKTLFVVSFSRNVTYSIHASRISSLLTCLSESQTWDAQVGVSVVASEEVEDGLVGEITVSRIRFKVEVTLPHPLDFGDEESACTLQGKSRPPPAAVATKKEIAVFRKIILIELSAMCSLSP